ncbi:MAG TPA: dephospho-CoA kinase [Armatimonadetes bacterium]|nr:dephospho-CoA kinase [Armatimonadota bacterium]
MYLIGLTGNIATGKSTVAKILAELGAEVIDSDALTRELYRPGTEVYGQIVAEFGEEILHPDGTIDRERLGDLVFADPQRLRRLEAIVHPAVEAVWAERLQRTSAQVVVVEAIKLIEVGYHRRCDALWVVTAPREAQIERLMKQRGWTREETERRIDAQSPPEEKLQLADVIIENAGTLEDLRRRVEAEWGKLIWGQGLPPG